MSSWEGFFGENSTASQFLLWSVASQIVGSILAPIVAAVEQGTWQLAVEGSGGAVRAAVAPADLADQVVRTILDSGTAETLATQSGVAPQDFARMVAGAGEPPGLDFMMQAYRRGYVPLGPTSPGTPSLLEGVATSRVYTYWSQVIEQMLSVPISPADAVEAVLRGQISQSDGETAAYANGVNASDFQILLDTAGNPPAPGELVELWRRGLIPAEGTGPDALTFQQGIYEGDAKDKWEPLYFKLTDYVPPPRTITTLLSHGAITEAQANAYFIQNGLSADLAAAYVTSATSEKLVSAKTLAESNVLKLYYDRLITSAEATPMLEQLGYTAADAAFLLELQDFTRAAAAYNSAVGRIGTLYTGRKITRASAVTALQSLDVPAATVTHLMSTWDAETAASIKTLTASEIADAYKYGVKAADWCITKLQDIGYDAHDAWVLISVANEAPAPNEPPDVGPSTGATPTDAE